MRRVWKDQVIDKIGMVNRGVFLVRFDSKEDQERACNMNGILFDKKPLIVKPWFPNISYDKASLVSIPVWVKLPKLDVVYWTEGALKSIVGYLGQVLKIDNTTLTKSRLMFARVLVDINISEGFPEELFFSNERDKLIAQPVQYDWIPVWCSKCSQFGHVNKDCRMGKPRQPLEVDENGFRVLEKAFQKSVLSQHRGVSQVQEPISDKVPSSDQQLEASGPLAPNVGEPHTLVLGQIDVDLRDTLVAVQTTNFFAALTPPVEQDYEANTENLTGINALGAIPIPVND